MFNFLKKKTNFSPLNLFCICIKNQLGIIVLVYFCIVYSVSLIYVSFPSPIKYCLDCSNYHNLILLLLYSFFVKMVLNFLVSLPSYINFKICLSVSVRNIVRPLIGIALNLKVDLGKTNSFTKVSLPIHDHNMSVHSFRSSLLSFLGDF